jgi:RHS repeat-associated protein
MTDPTGNEAYQYDALGRVTTLSKTVGSTVYPVQYGYDLVGNLKSITYPSGRAVQQSLDSLERVTQISSSGTNYLSGMAYNSAWQPTGFSYGNGVAASFGYNSHMQLASLAYTKSGSTLFSLAYDYSTGVPGNNGQIQKITDNVDATRTTTIVYDAWLRLLSWTNSQASVTESYDRYGNRLTQNLPVPSTVAVDVTTNHITTAGFAYDAAGNMTNDSINALTYDGENRLITSAQSGATYAYAYDGNGLRVKKTPPTGAATIYIFSGSKVIAEYASGAAPASPTSEYIYSGNQLIATLAGSTTTYHHADHLSTRVSTDSSGNTVRTFGHYPFGETWYETGTASKWKFTTYERDSESLNDYAIARIYVNRIARFSTPDQLGGNIENPQSLNRYAYVLNDPQNLSDPLGLCGGGPSDTGAPCSNFSYFDSNGCIVNVTYYKEMGDDGIVYDMPMESEPDCSLAGGDGGGGSNGGPGGGAGIQNSRDKARLLLSNPDCADFLKGLIAQINGIAKDKVSLDHFLAGFDSLKIIPTPPGDPGVGYPTTAHVDHTGQSLEVHVDAPSSPGLPQVLLHEDFHTLRFGQYDPGLAQNIWKSTAANGPDPGTLSGKDASRYNTQAFDKYCNPNKK